MTDDVGLAIPAGFDVGSPDPWGEYVPGIEIDLTGADPSVARPRDIFDVIVDRIDTTPCSNPIEGTRVRATDPAGSVASSSEYMADRLGNNHYWSTYGVGNSLVIDFDADNSGRRILPTGLFWQHTYGPSYRIQYFTVSGGNGLNLANVVWQNLKTVSDPNFLPASGVGWSDLLELVPPSEPIQYIRLTLNGVDSNNSEYLSFAEILWGGTLSPGEGGF